MASVFKEIWTFLSGSNKWSEVYYSTANSLDRAASFPESLLNARLVLLDPFNNLQKIRVSDTANPRASVVVYIRRSGISSLSGTGPAPASQAIVSTLVSTTFPSSRRLWMRGHAQGYASRNATTGVDTLAPTFALFLNAWFAKLADNGYVIYAANRVGQNGIVNQKVTQVDGTAGSGTSVVTLSAPPAFVAGQRVTFGSMSSKDFPGLNGEYAVQSVAGNTFTILYATSQNLLIKANTGKVHRVLRVDNASITASRSAFSFIGERKTKNDSTGSRGARSAKRIRLLA